MNDLEEYILARNANQKAILFYFHDLFINKYFLKPKISFGIPVYYKNKWLVYLNADKKTGVEVAFPNGFKLSEKHTILENKGRKMVKSVEFENIENIPQKKMIKIIDEAILVDKTLK